MTKMIKKSWTLFARTPDFKRTRHKSKTLRVPLLCGHLGAIPKAFAFVFKRTRVQPDDETRLNFRQGRNCKSEVSCKTISLLAKMQALRPYLPLIFVVLVYVCSAGLIVFALNLATLVTLLFLAIIIVCALRHIAQCFWALNLTEIGFDPDFYSLDCFGNKQSYVLLDPTIVTSFILVLNFRKLNLQPRLVVQDAEPSLFSFVKLRACLCGVFLKLNHFRPQSLVLTSYSVSAEDFRQLRIFLLSRKSAE